MKKIFQSENLFVLLTMFASIFGLILMSIMEKGEENLWFNLHNTILTDFFFKTITLIAEGYVFVPVVVLIWKYKGKQNALTIILSLIITGLIVQILKKFVFDLKNRPFEVLSKVHELRLIDGVKPLYHNSFPSGHTAIAFALMFCLAIIFKKRAATLVFFILAMLVGLSRIYLLQHFLGDVIAGALIGLSVTWIINRYFAKNKLVT